jgi:hypothetical protein
MYTVLLYSVYFLRVYVCCAAVLCVVFVEMCVLLLYTVYCLCVNA